MRYSASLGQFGVTDQQIKMNDYDGLDEGRLNSDSGSVTVRNLQYLINDFIFFTYLYFFRKMGTIRPSVRSNWQSYQSMMSGEAFFHMI